MDLPMRNFFSYLSAAAGLKDKKIIPVHAAFLKNASP